MRKIFWEDPYQHQLHTKVQSVHGNLIVFESTIAYSFSGGQESDSATVNGIKILDSKMNDASIYYTLPEGHGFSVGDSVFMEIDWPRRYRLMRLHFAAELILELVTRTVSIQKIGAHIAETKARIDFIYHDNISFLFEPLLKDYNQIIMDDLPIRTGYSDIQHQRRYWEIEGFSKVPCGGTHVKSTKEVGLITLKRANVGKEKERIEIKLIED